MTEDQKQPKFPFRSMLELSEAYTEQVLKAETRSVDLSQWLPSLKKSVRGLTPGELCFIMADTGHGKSMALQGVASSTVETSLFFSLELPDTLLFERFMANAHQMTCADVENSYREGKMLSWAQCGHILVCDETRLSMEGMKLKIEQARVRHPEACVVFVDYIGLMSGSGKSRYERMSSSAEDLKVLAKETKTIIVAATQRSRPGDGESPEVDLHDAKDSGSIENSADLFLGMWRDPEDESNQTLWVRVLKNRKGPSGAKIKCKIDGAKMTITEAAETWREDDAGQNYGWANG